MGGSCPWAASQHAPTDRQGCPRCDAHADPSRAEEASHTASQRPFRRRRSRAWTAATRSLCSWPCTTPKRARRRSRCPKTMVCGSTRQARGLGSRRTESPIDRGVVPSSLSLCHSANWPNQAAGKGPLTTQHRLHLLHGHAHTPNANPAAGTCTSPASPSMSRYVCGRPQPTATLSASTESPWPRRRQQTRAKCTGNAFNASPRGNPPI